MKKTDWAITWLAALMPEPTMIPPGDVFFRSVQKYSLVALDDHATSLLFPNLDTLVAVAEQAGTHRDVEDSDITIQESIQSDASTDLEEPQANQDFLAFLDAETCFPM